ncbi:hypothetical protein HYALB_00006746 [Hymenoscyphus albidus]|uniref:Uncharacterized protein n=1 Tax=Hymenoscyphus albidus TaxID=595503 RepID=A0A9N9LL68_9HELO|nr:hypothetical protein HYALB_00006746 [Hymenoscyphus albidus]
MAQKLWFVMKESGWNLFHIRRAGTVGVDLPFELVKFGPLGTRESLADIKRGDLVAIGTLKNPENYDYVRFCAEVFPNQQDREAFLSLAGGESSAIRFMGEFIEGFLKEIVKKTEKIRHRPKGTRRRTTFTPCCTRMFRRYPRLTNLLQRLDKPYHVVLKVTLNSEEEFAIDLAGAQYGHHQPVIPWDEFQRTRVLEITSTIPPRTPHGLLKVDDYRMDAMLKQNVKINRHGSKDFELEALAMLMRLWQSKNLGFRDLWNLPMDEFVRRNRELVDFVHWNFNHPSLGTGTARGKLLRDLYPNVWPHYKT